MRYSDLIGALTAGHSVGKRAFDIAMGLLESRVTVVFHTRNVLRWGLRERQLIDDVWLTWMGEKRIRPSVVRHPKLVAMEVAREVDAPASPRHAFATSVSHLLPEARRAVRQGPEVSPPAISTEAAGEVAFALLWCLQEACADMAVRPVMREDDDRALRASLVAASIEEMLGVELVEDLLDDWGHVETSEQAEAYELDREGMEMMRWRHVSKESAESLRMLMPQIDDLSGIPYRVWRACAMLHRGDEWHMDRHCPIWWLAASYRLWEGHAPVRDLQQLDGPFACGLSGGEIVGRECEVIALTPTERDGLATMVALLLAECESSTDPEWGRYVCAYEVHQLDREALALLYSQLTGVQSRQ